MKKFLASLPLIGIICLFTFGIIIASGCEKLEPTSKLDSYELHYDADGYFLLINDNDNLMGVYDGPEALEHFYLDLNCNGEYISTTVEGLEELGVELTSEIEDYLFQNNIPYDTPVVILSI